MKKNVLFISSSIGLGHAARDLAIAREVKKRNPEIEISWLAGDPAKMVIEEAGEYLLPECELLGNDSYLAEKVSNGYGLNVNNYLFRVLLEWRKSIITIRKLTKRKNFDLIIADEAYECICQPKIRSEDHRILGHFIANYCAPVKKQRHFFITNLTCKICEIEGCSIFS